MAKLSYVSEKDIASSEIAERIRARRGGKLLQIDRIMLHSAVYAGGWNSFVGAVNKDLALGQKLREMIMCAVGAMNGANYEVLAHGPRYISAGGSQEQLDALGNVKEAAGNATLFGEQERAALALAVEMTYDVEVNDATLMRARIAMTEERLVVELIGLIAAYNMVSRFVVACGIEAVDGQL
jgi:alkylhydroperoxidase family enzyme